MSSSGTSFSAPTSGACGCQEACAACAGGRARHAKLVPEAANIQALPVPPQVSELQARINVLVSERDALCSAASVQREKVASGRVILAYVCVKLQMRSYVCQAPCPFWVHFGSILGPFWVHFGSILGPFWVYFASLSISIQPRIGI